MKFPGRPAADQLVRLAALGVGERVRRAATTPAPRRSSSGTRWWQYVTSALSGTPVTAAPQAARKHALAGSATPPIPVSGGARIYVFPQQNRRRLP